MSGLGIGTRVSDVYRYPVYTEALRPGGQPAAGAELSFYIDSEMSELAVLYASPSGPGTLDNPYVVPSDGRVIFWTADPSLWVLAEGDTEPRPLAINTSDLGVGPQGPQGPQGPPGPPGPQGKPGELVLSNPGELPAFSSYLASGDTEGNPDAPTGFAGETGLTTLLLTWDLPAEALWRTWELYEGAEDNFEIDLPILTTNVNFAVVKHASSTGPWYYKLRAVNTRGEYSTFVQAGPFTMPQVTNTDVLESAINSLLLDDDAVDLGSAKVTGTLAVANLAAANAIIAHLNAGSAQLNNAIIGVLSADKLATPDALIARLNAGSAKIAAARIANLDAGKITTGILQGVTIQGVTITSTTISSSSITGASILGSVITGSLMRTAEYGKRVEIGGASADDIRLFMDDLGPGWMTHPLIETGVSFVENVSLETNNYGLLIRGPDAVDTNPPVIALTQVRRYDGLTAGTKRVTMVAGEVCIGQKSGSGRPGGGITITPVPLKVYGDIYGAANLEVAGRIFSPACISGTSLDGIWVGDLDDPIKLWKLYMKGNKLYARWGTGGSQYVVIGP